MSDSIGGGLGYYSNLNEAQAQVLMGKDAHIYAAEDIAIDIALEQVTMAVAGGIVTGCGCTNRCCSSRCGSGNCYGYIWLKAR